jgi:hypothetical protein
LTYKSPHIKPLRKWMDEGGKVEVIGKEEKKTKEYSNRCKEIYEDKIGESISLDKDVRQFN